jgi:hypothetical protein
MFSILTLLINKKFKTIFQNTSNFINMLYKLIRGTTALIVVATRLFISYFNNIYNKSIYD